MELHYTVATVLFIVLVLVVCFLAVSMFIPLYWNARGSPLFNTTTRVIYSTHNSQTSTLTPASSEIHSTHSTHVVTTTTTTLLTTPPPGELRIRSYHIRDSEDTIRVGLVFENTYPVEVIVEKIYLNDTLVYKGHEVIESKSFLDKYIKDPILAEAMVTIWINTGIKPAPNSVIIACGKMITVGNLTIYYRIPNVIGTYNITVPLELPECMVKEYTIIP